MTFCMISASAEHSLIMFAITLSMGWVRFNAPPNILQYRSYIGDGFFTGQQRRPNYSVKALKKGRVLRIRLQSHQVHPTVLQYYDIFAVWNKNTKHTHTNKSMHSEMGPVWQNPIQRTVRTAHPSVLMTAQLLYITQHRTVLIIFPLTSTHHSSVVVKLCQILHYFDKFWHMHTSKNFPQHHFQRDSCNFNAIFFQIYSTVCVHQ